MWWNNETLSYHLSFVGWKSSSWSVHEIPPYFTTLESNTESLSQWFCCSEGDPDPWPFQEQRRDGIGFFPCWGSDSIMLNWPRVVCGRLTILPPPLVWPHTSVFSLPQWDAPWKSGQGHQTSRPDENKDRDADSSKEMVCLTNTLKLMVKYQTMSRQLFLICYVAVNTAAYQHLK